jgi:hypothetical protein
MPQVKDRFLGLDWVACMSMEATPRRSVYLDTNHWYALGRAMAGHPDRPEHVDILRTLAEQVEQEQLMFPLSAVHYMEVAENPRDDHRKEIADVMALLSRFNTITSAGKIIDEELAQALHARLGRPTWPIKVEKFGYGATFALTGKQGGLGRVTGGSEEDRRELESKLGKPIAEWEAELNAFAEYMLIRQPNKDIWDEIPGYDPYAARRMADKELASFNVLVDTVHNNPDVVSRPLDAIYARQFLFEFMDNYTRALMSAGFGGQRTPFHSREELSEFLEAMPSRRVATMLQFHYLKDTNKHWKINDLRDNVALSKAIPYCDIVVTDSEVWDVAVNRAHLDREFSTPILRRLTDLAAHL